MTLTKDPHVKMISIV